MTKKERQDDIEYYEGLIEDMEQDIEYEEQTIIDIQTNIKSVRLAIQETKAKLNELKGNSPATDGTGLPGLDQGKVQGDSEVQQGDDGEGSGSAGSGREDNDDRTYGWEDYISDHNSNT